MRHINILMISHNHQRYDTVGDYWEGPDGTIEVRISVMKNRAYEMLVLLHELTELQWCLDNRVSFKAIDDFDKSFKGSGEPGDDPRAPYYRGHQIASAVERVACMGYGLDWETYNTYVDSL